MHVLPGAKETVGPATVNNSIIEHVKLLMAVGLVVLSLSAIVLNIWLALEPKPSRGLATNTNGLVSKYLQKRPCVSIIDART